MNELAKELIKGAEVIGIKLSKAMIEKFNTYREELLVWNKKMNLISMGDESRIVKRHFLDSLNATKFIPPNASVLDVGSGAGFPGVPIKIVREDIKLDLLEPKFKRCDFLNHLVNVLSLEIGVYMSRVENFSGKYDVILSRAVGKLKWLTKVATPLLATDGRVITYKGTEFWTEFYAMDMRKELNRWEVESRERRKFCGGTIVVLKKVSRLLPSENKCTIH